MYGIHISCPTLGDYPAIDVWNDAALEEAVQHNFGIE